MPFRSLLRTLAAATFLAAAGVSSQNCQHGLTANDVAADSGLDLTGRVALVTGGRSGLGYAITEALLTVGCKVVIASRNLSKNRQAVKDLKDTVSGADVSFMTFDLESFDSVRALAADFLGNHTRLDYYFGNAGQGAIGTQPLTVDGYERIFQVNYVSQAVLVELMLPLLRKYSGRVLLTASSAHATACGDLGLGDQCWGDDGGAIAKLPFDQAGLDAIDNTFECGFMYSSYATTKFLMTQLAREVAKREADNVDAYSWAPGFIYTDLNPFATCCVGPIDNPSPCRYQLPYVGPKDDDGNPNPPNPPVHNHWTSPAHGAMAAVYAALVANSTQSGSFYATYWECQAEKGYFSQGITPSVREEIYERSKSWAGIASSNATISMPSATPTISSTTSSGTTLPMFAMASFVVIIGMGLIVL